MINLSEHNLYDFVDIDYRMEYDCESWGCDSICRCGQIEEEVVELVNVSGISKFIYDTIFDDSISSKRNLKIESIIGEITEEINLYTIDRILRINKVFGPLNWDIEINGGYYGDEIGEVILSKYISKKIESELNIAMDITSLSSRINYLLELEYGYLLKELIGVKWEIVDINKSDIYFGNDNHKKRVSDKNLEFYNDSNYKSIRGVFVKSGNTLRIIDGYHRCYRTNNNKIRVFLANL